jgi:alpha-tubulin suppressor-like RCC1 family protein
MSRRWQGGLISANSPTIVPPTDGEGGSTSGIWTLDQQQQAKKTDSWPLRALFRALYAWGYNGSGQLGLNDAISRSSPVQSGSKTDWKILGASKGIKTDGTLWSWGSGGNGLIGDNTNISKSSAVQIGSGTTWRDIAVGDKCFAIKTDGTLWAWGNTAQGSLGDNQATITYSSPIQIGALTNWYKVRPGQVHTLAVKTNGTLWAWGSNFYGQVGDNTSGYVNSRSSPVQIGADTNWADVDGGYRFSLARKTTGSIWAWGRGFYGERSSNDQSSVYSPVQIGALTSWAWISAGADTAKAIKTDGTLWSWGKGNRGAIGDGSAINRSSMVQIGVSTDWRTISAYSNTGAIKTNGTLWAWGRGNNGQLGDNAIQYRSSPSQVGVETYWNNVITSAQCTWATTIL